MGPLMAIAPMALSVASTAMGVVSALQQGKAASAAAKSEQAQRQKVAGEIRARGQRESEEERRKGRLVSSRALAVGGADGSLLDPSFNAIIGGIGEESEYNARLVSADAELQAQGQEFAGAMAKARGKAAKRASYMNAIGTAMSGASSFAGKYDTYKRGKNVPRDEIVFWPGT